MTATNATTATLTVIGNGDSITYTSNINIERDVSYILKKLGIRNKFTGYGYLKTAICLFYENPDEYYLITKCLYPVIAKTYMVNTTAVERAIRNAISHIKCSDSIKEEIIGYAADGYTNKEIISSVSEYIRYL